MHLQAPLSFRSPLLHGSLCLLLLLQLLLGCPQVALLAFYLLAEALQILLTLCLCHDRAYSQCSAQPSGGMTDLASLTHMTSNLHGNEQAPPCGRQR